MLERIDLSWVAVMWAPVFFVFMMGLALLASESFSIRSLAFVVPVTWGIVNMVGFVSAVENNLRDDSLTDVLVYQTIGLWGVALLLGFFMVIRGLMPMLFSGKRKTARS